jgi:hypothetical protein
MEGCSLHKAIYMPATGPWSTVPYAREETGTTEVTRVRDLQDLNIRIMRATCGGRQFDRHIDREDGSAGGWVESTAFAGEDTHITRHVLVLDGATVSGKARLTGYVVLSDYSEASDNAELSGAIEVRGDARIYEDAKVQGTADGLIIEGGVLLHGNVDLSGYGRISGPKDLDSGAIVRERKSFLVRIFRRDA